MDPLLSPEQLASVHEALRRDRKIEAIKLYREATRSGLKEAKDAVEAMEVPPESASGNAPSSPVGSLPNNRTPPPGWNTAPEKKKGCFAVVVAFLGMAAVVAVFWF